MISEMLTRVPGPNNKKLDPSRIVFSDKMEGTNIWDVDGNRFLDLTSGGGLLPFGFVDNGTVAFKELAADLSGYTGQVITKDPFADKKLLLIGDGVTSAFVPPTASENVQLFELANMTKADADIVIVKSQYLDELSIQRVASWCRQWDIPWVADESDFGMFRRGLPLSSAEFEPDYILTAIAGEGMEITKLMFTLRGDDSQIDDVRVAKNYSDKDLQRTNKLQEMELTGLLHDSIEGREIGCVGAYHSIELESLDEVSRVCHELLQRGIIVATMANKIVLMPSLYLALGEIIFAVNHLRLVIADINEMSLPWMNEDLRK